MEVNNANTQFGLPTKDAVSDKVQQAFDDTCAIKSQEIVMNAVGLDVSEYDLREEAMQNGWYSPGFGTPMEDVGKLMEAHGLDIQQQIHGNMFNLVSELSKGHPVIVGVDSGELWNPGFEEELEDLYHPQADHALIVSGFAINPLTGSESILLTDPGTGELFANYPVDLFEDAWDDSNNYMVNVLE